MCLGRTSDRRAPGAGPMNPEPTAPRPAPRRALCEDDLAALDAALAPADAERLSRYPGDRTDRQPEHTVYVPADRFHPGLVPAWGAAAADGLAAHAPGPGDVAAVVGLSVEEVHSVWAAMVAKLAAEPIEDLRVDL